MSDVSSERTKVAIVTGANSGVGYETTIGLARAGLRVVLACRSLDKARVAMKMAQERVPAAVLEVAELDLSRFPSVRAFAQSFRKQHDRLDILVNNAGVLDYSGRRNDDGIELQFATNHLGHFLLTSLLFDLLPDRPDSRVVSLSSLAHKKGEIAFEDLNCDNPPAKDFAYAQSKLACLMFAIELDRRLKRAGRSLISVAAHPGGTDSGLFDDMSRVVYYTFKLLKPFILHSNESAARSPLHAALSPDVKGGGYYGPQGFMDLKGPPGRASRTEYSEQEDVASRLWSVSEDLVGSAFPIAEIDRRSES